MSRISTVFKPGHKALIGYITVGYPSIEATLEVVPVLAGNGCDIIELGIPFSDPLADGATIQKASFCALQNGVTPGVCLDIARQLRSRIDAPLVFMTYYNPVFSYGLEGFCAACASSGVDGLIIPDLPPEEGAELETLAVRHNLDLIYLLAPTSPDKRVRLVAEKSRGFIYLVSVAGVTGARDRLPEDLSRFIGRVRGAAAQPLCVGFGISKPEQAAYVAGMADGIIVGSRIIELVEGGNAASVVSFIGELRRALDAAQQ